MKLRLEHLPADAIGLPDHARRALGAGALGGSPVARSLTELERPQERHEPGRRALLVQDLERGLADFALPARVETSLSVLANPGTFCVLTGQQPGFLGGALLTLYKAVQACRLATGLARAWGVPVVPVFWNHADDHDVAEVQHAYLLNRNLDLQRAGLAGLSSGRQPIGRILLEEQRNRLGATRAMVVQAFEEFAGAETAVDLLFPRPGESLARALSRALTALLGEHGLVVVEPDWIRSSLSRALADVVAVDPVARLLEGSGESPAIDPTEAALVYRVDPDGRRPLRAGGDGFRYDGEAGSRTPAELAAEIVQEVERWSAGALLRPLVQDAVFPACAYVGGWGELAYHAQLGPLRDACSLPRTPFVPRVSATLVEEEVRLALTKTGASLRDVLDTRGAFDVEAPGDTPAVIDELRASAERAERELLALRSALAELDPALAVNLKRAADQARKAIEKVAAKAERVHANRSGKGRRHVRRLNNTLFPRGQPQERVLGPLGPTARYGRAWVEALYADFPPVCSEHLAIHLELNDGENG